MQAEPLQHNVDNFLKLQKKQRIISADKSHSIIKIIEESTPLDLAQAKVVLGEFTRDPSLDQSIVSEVSRILLEATGELNSFNNARRLFSFETINFIGTLENLKVTADTILHSPKDQLDQVAYSFIKSFPGTDKVVQTLLECDSLYTEDTKDSQIFGLNYFRFELAAKVLNLFEPSFIKSCSKSLKIDEDLALDFLRNLIKHVKPSEIRANFLDLGKFQIALTELIVYVQAHKRMPVYAKKRYDYLKLFMAELTYEVKLLGIQPANMAKVVACFLYANEQYMPKKELIGLLASEETHDSAETQEKLNKFLSQLAPSTVDALLKDIRDFMSKLLTKPEKDFWAIFESTKERHEKGKKDNSILGLFYNTMMELKGIGIMAINNVNEIVGDIIDQYHLAEEKGEAGSVEELFDEVPTDLDQVEENKLIPKSPKVLEHLKNYRLVETNEVGIKGEKSEGGKRAYAANLVLLGGEANLPVIKKSFENLFEYLVDSSDDAIVCNEFKHPQSPQTSVKEYYTAFLLPGQPKQDRTIFCLGISYFYKELSMLSENKDEASNQYMDPYCFLMSTSNSETVMNARSRRISSGDKDVQKVEFKAMNLRLEHNKKLCLLSLLEVLHIIPFNHWESRDVQESILFLSDTLDIDLTEDVEEGSE